MAGLTLLAVGLKASSRGYGLLAIALLSLTSIVYIVRSTGRPDAGQILFLTPSILTCLACAGWAWRLLGGDRL